LFTELVFYAGKYTDLILKQMFLKQFYWKQLIETH
jgi:hypothetical protein